jgi:hypothetical protein
MKQFLWRILLVAAGSAMTLLALMGLPTIGLALYGTAFRTAYVECQLAEAHAAKLNSLSLDSALNQRLQKTEEIDELSCLDYQSLRSRLEQFKVSSAELNLLETRAVSETASLHSYIDAGNQSRCWD